MEADGLSRRASMETPGVDSRVTGAPGGAGFRWLDGRVLDVTGGFVGSLSPRMTGGHDFAPVLHRATPEPSTSVEPEIDYEGLPQGAATSTHMLAGSVAGIMEHCLMYPIDCVKVQKANKSNTLLLFEMCFRPCLCHSESRPRYKPELEWR